MAGEEEEVVVDSRRAAGIRKDWNVKGKMICQCLDMSFPFSVF